LRGDGSGPFEKIVEEIVAARRMTLITVKLSARELELLTALASDQLFRREFIDPRLPGHNSNPAEVMLGKKLVERLRLMADPSKPLPRRNGAHAL
jgi:hypothetical protein